MFASPCPLLVKKYLPYFYPIAVVISAVMNADQGETSMSLCFLSLPHLALVTAFSLFSSLSQHQLKTTMRFQNPLTSFSFLFAIVAILAFSQVAEAKACSNGLTLCESGSVGCNGNYCTVKARGQTRYFCRESFFLGFILWSELSPAPKPLHLAIAPEHVSTFSLAAPRLLVALRLAVEAERLLQSRLSQLQFKLFNALGSEGCSGSAKLFAVCMSFFVVKSALLISRHHQTHSAPTGERDDDIDRRDMHACP